MNCGALASPAARLRKLVCSAGFAALTAGLALTMNVSAAPTAVAACVAALTPGGIEVGARGAAGLSFAVAIAPGCAYDVSSNSPFIVVTSAASGVGSGSVTFLVQPNSGPTRRGSIAVAGLTFTVKQAKRTSVAATPFDFDGDGKSDIGVYRPSSGTWFVLQSLVGATTAVQFGFGADVPVPADYDGDGKVDVAIYRPSNGTWYILGSSRGFYTVQWGFSTDMPVPADYDGDGKADVAIYRPSNGTWYVLGTTSGVTVTQFGSSTDVPVAADYDGDGKADVAIYRPSNGTWYVLGTTSGFASTQFGLSTDIPVPADYDGDGKTDIGVYRPSTGTWYLLRSSAGFSVTQYGVGNDLPLPSVYLRR